MGTGKRERARVCEGEERRERRRDTERASEKERGAGREFERTG